MDIEEQIKPSATTSISGDTTSPTATSDAADTALFPRDPVTGTPIPPKGAPSNISRDAMRQHLHATKELSHGLASDRSEIPEGLEECLDLIAKMTPHPPGTPSTS